MSVPSNEMAAMNMGIAKANAPDPASAVTAVQEEAASRQWLNRIAEARKFDEGARKQYALDRRHAKRRGGKNFFEIDVPVAASYIDVLKSYLYARDPDVDVLPSEATAPPPDDDLVRMAKQALAADPNTKMAIDQAAMAAFQESTGKKNTIVQAVAPAAAKALDGGQVPSQLPQLPDIDPKKDAEAAARATMDKLIRAKVKELSQPYQQRRDDAKQFGSTLEIVINQMWKKARLKAKAKPMVGSSLTVAIGWIKATWQERTGIDPIIQSQINDLQDNLARLSATREALAEGEGDPDALEADIKIQIQGLQAKVEVLVARGLAIDFVAAEDIQVAPECGPLWAYLDSPWIAHRTFKPTCEAKAMFPRIASKLNGAATYGQVKPADPNTPQDASSGSPVAANEADSYRPGNDSATKVGDGDSVCIWEVWDKDANTILTFVEGLNAYAREPYQPDPGTSRFYPFFQFAIGEVDGERHPESLPNRSAQLLDEYNRTRSAYVEHRRRVRPKTAFDASGLSAEDAQKIEAGGTQEMIGLKPQKPGTPVGQLLQPIAYAPIDAALYDNSQTRADLEMIWGIQEALSSSIRTPKTATEAEIQQAGTNARTGYMRDGLDQVMGELAEYTAEVAVQKLDRKDAIDLAGPWAFWPEGMSIEDLGALVTVDIRAGSSGKPDTTRQRQAWATVMPVLQNAIMQVGQLRGSNPQDVADSIEALIEETLQRTGDRLDAARFLPASPDPDDQPQMPQMGSPQIPAPQPPQSTLPAANDDTATDTEDMSNGY